MNVLINFFNHPFFIIFGGISATILVAGILLNFIFWILGIAPLLLRLGYGRWFRNIAIVSNDEYFNSLKNDLIQSGLFREKNIFQISPQSLSKVREYNLLLVHYQSFTEKSIKKILEHKRSKAGMIFYYPGYSAKNKKIIPDKLFNEINNMENVTLVNFRGRLLNDIVITLITTSYEKK